MSTARQFKKDATGPNEARVLLISGMSGAGKSSVLGALEDIGYEAVDNLPLTLLERLVSPDGGFDRPVAIGVDIRTRDFDAARLAQEAERLKGILGLDAQLVFVDCNDDVLQRRFTETRRRHPLAIDRPVTDGIRDERAALLPVRERADLIVDTTTYTLGDLRDALSQSFALGRRAGLNVIVMSFAYSRGLPRGADLVFDVRFLRNPHYDESLRPLTGLDSTVGEFVSKDEGFDSFFDKLVAMLLPLLPRYEREGKSYLTIAVGCTGGRHRSVFVAEHLAARLGEERPVTVRHRDLNQERDRPAGEGKQ